MRAKWLMVVGCWLLVAPGFAQGPKPANLLLKAAQTKAAREHKAVFVVFDASW